MPPTRSNKTTEAADPTLADIMCVLKSFKTDTEQNFNSLIDDVSELKTKSSQMEHRIEGCEFNVSSIGIELEIMKQKQLKNNICIDGVPGSTNENIRSIFKAICFKLEINVHINSVIAAYRTKGSNNRLGSIVVQLDNSGLKAAIMNKMKIRKSLLVEEINIGLNNNNNQIFIFNHVTPYFSHLLYIGRQAIKNKQLSSCWLASNGVFVTLNENNNKVLINNEEQLVKLISRDLNPALKRKLSSNDDDSQNDAIKKQAKVNAIDSGKKNSTEKQTIS